MSGIWDLPGLFTAANNADRPGDAGSFYQLGYRWISQQAQNDWKILDCDLSAFSQAGFNCGVWGVTYRPGDFQRDMANLSDQARKFNAQHIIVDAEECIKETDPTPIIEGLAWYSGPKALSTLGAPWGTNLYPINYNAFLNAGWDILAQAYYPWALSFHPAHCVEHAEAQTIPLTRFHLTLDSADEFQQPPQGLGRPWTAEEWVQGCHDARLATPDISIFMAEFKGMDWYQKVSEITLQKVGEEHKPQNPFECREEMLKDSSDQILRWRQQGMTKGRIARQRITIAHDILALPDARFSRKADALRKLINAS